jgi:membrane-bound metal-dependent hydrolase YbcI (DUF457 family)
MLEGTGYELVDSGRVGAWRSCPVGFCRDVPDPAAWSPASRRAFLQALVDIIALDSVKIQHLRLHIPRRNVYRKKMAVVYGDPRVGSLITDALATFPASHWPLRVPLSKHVVVEVSPWNKNAPDTGKAPMDTAKIPSSEDRANKEMELLTNLISRLNSQFAWLLGSNTTTARKGHLRRQPRWPTSKSSGEEDVPKTKKYRSNTADKTIGGFPT